MSEPVKSPFNTNSATATRQLALAAAHLGERFVDAVRAAQAAEVEALLDPSGPAHLAFELFGLALFRLDLRLDDPREAGLLTPYDLQIEDDLALLEMGVTASLPAAGSDQDVGGRAHLARVFGSGLLLRRAGQGWQISEVFPVNSGGRLRPDDPADQAILAVHQGRAALPLRQDSLEEVELNFLTRMQARAPGYNLAELYNAVRLWRDFRRVEPGLSTAGHEAEWAAGVEYLIAIFDYHSADPAGLAAGYGAAQEAVTDRAREIAAALRVTQFDDKYSLHPDPVAHFRRLFGELGIDPRKDEKIRQAALHSGVFNSIEVPPDDDTFFGPGSGRG